MQIRSARYSVSDIVRPMEGVCTFWGTVLVYVFCFFAACSDVEFDFVPTGCKYLHVTDVLCNDGNCSDETSIQTKTIEKKIGCAGDGVSAAAIRFDISDTKPGIGYDFYAWLNPPEDGFLDLYADKCADGATGECNQKNWIYMSNVDVDEMFYLHAQTHVQKTLNIGYQMAPTGFFKTMQSDQYGSIECKSLTDLCPLRDGCSDDDTEIDMRQVSPATSFQICDEMYEGWRQAGFSILNREGEFKIKKIALRNEEGLLVNFHYSVTECSTTDTIWIASPPMEERCDSDGIKNTDLTITDKIGRVVLMLQVHPSVGTVFLDLDVEKLSH